MRWSSKAFVGLALMILTAATYWPVLSCDFVNFDDVDYVIGNYDLLKTFTWSTWTHFWTHTVSSNWHPLTMLSLAVDAHLWGERAAGYHATNLVFHCLNVALLFLALEQMTGCQVPSICVAALFGLHPLHVESVAWISERKDVLCTFFLLVTILAYVRYAFCPSPIGYIPVLILFTLGLLSKPMLVTLPVLLLLLDFWPLDRIPGFHLTGSKDTSGHSRFAKRTPSQLLLEKIPLVLLSLADGVVTIVAQETSRSVLSNISFATRVTHAFSAYFWYLKKTLLPMDLIVLYLHPEENVSWSDATIGFLASIVITLIAAAFAKTKPHLIVGWGWFVISLLPVIGLIQVGAQAYADRYAYIPHIGLFTAVVWEIDSWVSGNNRARVVSATGFTLIIVICAALSQLQIGYWKNSGTLWRHALEVNPDNGLAHISLGDYLLANHENEAACEHFERGIELADQHATTAYSAAAHCELGLALMGLNRLDEAEQNLKQSLEINPDYLMALGELIKLLIQQNRSSEVAEYSTRYETIAAQRSTNTGLDHKVEVELGLLRIREGNLDEARWYFERATQIAPYSAVAFNNLANTQFQLQEFQEAKRNFLKALELNPDLSVAHHNLASILELEGDREGARQHYAEAYRIDPQDFAAGRRADQLSQSR